MFSGARVQGPGAEGLIPRNQFGVEGLGRAGLSTGIFRGGI